MGSTMEVEKEDASLAFAMQLASASIVPYALKVAVELDLLELMKKKGPDAFVSPAEIAAELPSSRPDTHNKLDRILRLLSCYSIVICSVKTMPDGGVERLYSLAPVSKFFTKNEDGVSLGLSLIMSLDRIPTEAKSHLKDSILDGGNPFEKAHKMSGFEYLGTDPRFNKVFNSAMSGNSTIVMKKLVETYEGFKGIQTLVDVGGGIGASLQIILSKHPKIKGINFDLPHVIQNAPSYAGVENIGGDMFVGVPKGDAIFMKWILHDWGDTHCLKILERCREALSNNGKIIVLESILPEIPSEGLICDFQLDVAMLTFNPGGKERTENEFHALAKRAGFKECRMVCRVAPFWVLEFYK
ncbi:caffeic acid 3-O-methyltransferase [Dorcoceras hygrometricum]|uniref:Caffeic acid 3-O-methyltransferase n=1 Tax=Dorcoceras hygrometricum TaxID=472368 RepID=A0A2Z7BSN6_9LAMI|nr:caffeic acid 3-O-methyltransferase [Dorcoceras hygrometricum]